ncbi:unnamed protein product [Blepharisma stoltei]|uniref:ATP synthase mitochondrial F1 complex assembly factor 1 n=1 Tax=Blepharisma stoltei TaxID=1481888 RepID=A0AAU9I7K1_9CILI|nr:unnamed protein product [Blepharisma stoltei]
MILRRAFVFTYPCPRKMREIVKLSLIEKEEPSEIKRIWNEYHLNRPNNVSTVITAHQYDLLLRRTKASPIFIFPLKRKAGHFVLVSQAQEKSNLLTYLEDFKKNPATATPYFVLTLFDELLAKKGIVPVRGDIVDFLIAKPEAELLLKAFLAHYIEGGLYEETVQIFNHDPNNFNHQKYVDNFFNRFSTQ